MNRWDDSLLYVIKLKWFAIYPDGYNHRMLPVGFVLELSLLLILASTVPGFVPRVMGWIWPETINA